MLSPAGVLIPAGACNYVAGVVRMGLQGVYPVPPPMRELLVQLEMRAKESRAFVETVVEGTGISTSSAIIEPMEVTTTVAGELMDISRQHVLNLINSGDLPARRDGRRYLIPAEYCTKRDAA